MIVRAYLAKILLSDNEEIGYYSAMDPYARSYAFSRRVFGGDWVDWMLINAKVEDDAPLLADSNLFPLLDVGPEFVMDDLGDQEYERLSNGLAEHGVPSHILDNAVTYRNFIHDIGAYLLGQSWQVNDFFTLN